MFLKFIIILSFLLFSAKPDFNWSWFLNLQGHQMVWHVLAFTGLDGLPVLQVFSQDKFVMLVKMMNPAWVLMLNCHLDL